MAESVRTVEGDLTLVEDSTFDSGLVVYGNIDAQDINAKDINAKDINAGNIDAQDINAGNVSAFDIRAMYVRATSLACLHASIHMLVAGPVDLQKPVSPRKAAI
jgi:hypothetical protein